MSTFIQLHLLTSYPPANLNRDDLGRPKTAVVGGTQRLRISSQSLKRAWRTSETFQETMAGHLGIRTKDMGNKIQEALVSGKSLEAVLKDEEDVTDRTKVSEKQAIKIALSIAEVFGKLKQKKEGNKNVAYPEIEQLAHFSPEEIKAISDLLESVKQNGRVPDESELNLLREKDRAVDISMFGRMLASKPLYNVEAAVQVAHAFSVQTVTVEDDYFTAVDDLNKGEEDAGAAHLGVTEFASGLFYIYICINEDLLSENLSGNDVLVKKSLKALAEAAAKVGPTGKQNSFASRSYASYILAEKGTKQPRSLAVAFLEPVSGRGNMLEEAIKNLEMTRDNIDRSYGKVAEKKNILNAHKGTGTLQELCNFITE